MKFGKRDKSIVDALFILAVFGIFLVCALFIVLFGAKIYKNTVKASSDSFFERTCTTYITEKIRQNDCAKGVEINNNNGSPVIVLTKSVDDIEYVTYLFMNDGYLREYTTTAGNEFNPLSGIEIIPISSLEAKRCNDNLYQFDITNDDGNRANFYVSITSSVSNGGDLGE